MQQWPTTRNTLLVNLAGKQHQSAWFDFSHLYEPVIYRFARRRGLQHTDAIELTQQVMLKVMKSAENWSQDQPPNHFRAWLKTVANNTLINMLTRDQKHRAAGTMRGEDESRIGQDARNEQSERRAIVSANDEELWESEELRSILRCAAQNIRSEFSADSWQAFERTLLGNESVEDVARDLQKKCGAIYAARARIVRRLKSESQRLLEEER